MILLRRTHLQPEKEIRINVPGIIDIVLGRTDEGIVYEGVEVLTKNVKHIGFIAAHSSLPYSLNRTDAYLYHKTSIGYLSYSATELHQLNSNLEIVASIPLNLYTALKMLSTKKNFTGEDVGISHPIMLMTDYALTQLGYNANKVPMIFEDGTHLYTKLFGKVAKHSETFLEDRKHIVAVYSEVNKLEDVIETVNNYKCYSLYSEAKFVIWNDVVHKINEFGVELKAPVYM